MGTRPPTLREKRRYLLVALEPAGTAVDQKDLYYALSDATTQLWGDATAAVITPAVVASEGQFFIIRCRRGTEHELAIALSTITTCRDTRIALRMVAASGTIESLRERIRCRMSPGPDQLAPGECIFDKKTFQLSQCNGQKVDVIEKGFKNTNRLFLTREDMEEL
ncbi:MAG TPA: Rpp14/Pop5 family protein [Methanoregula sp.]|nr:Rpp14/Pop5 family protein [Methanoregula sp.]